MSVSPLEALLKRDRLVIGAALVLLTVLAWAYLFSIGGEMAAMPGMNMMTPSLTFAMWAIMMVGMMTPSAAPMILIYARVARDAAVRGQPFASAGWFAGGYLLSWTVFALIAAAGQGLLERAALLTPAMSLASRQIGGAILIVAAVYQWTPLKDSCLSQCRNPLIFIQQHGGFSRTVSGSLKLGFQHGVYCIGCCWTLMTLLFVVGVMNFLWIAGLAILVLLEKAVPPGRLIGRIASFGFAAFGLWLLANG